MNSLDKQYQNLLQDILDNGIKKEDRTGTGTLSVFGRTIRHRMGEGFPILTSKKLYMKGVIVELIWFLLGETNIKYLVDNDVHIWDGDCYQAYKKEVTNLNLWDFLVIDSGKPRPYTQEEFINKIKTDDEFAKKFGELGPIYGKQWRSWENSGIDIQNMSEDGTQWSGECWNAEPIDQISNLINDLKTNPDSRRLMVTAWNPSDLESSVLPPCHYGFQMYTRELSIEERSTIQIKTNDYASFYTKEEMDNNGIPQRAISLMYNARSQDVPLGTPFNLASYGLLLEIIAKEVNMVPDELIANMGDCHIYLNQIDPIKEQLTREPYPLPKLECKDEYWYLNDLDISFSEKIKKFKPDFFKVENYQSHPPIKIPLSN